MTATPTNSDKTISQGPGTRSLKTRSPSAKSASAETTDQAPTVSPKTASPKPAATYVTPPATKAKTTETTETTKTKAQAQAPQKAAEVLETASESVKSATEAIKEATASVNAATKAEKAKSKLVSSLKRMPFFDKKKDEDASSIWDFQGHLESAKELLRTVQEKWEDGKKQLTALAEHDRVQAAKAWWTDRDTRPADHPDDTRATIDRLEVVARVFDGIKIPIAGKEVGLGADLALNFFPGGNWVSMGAHGYMLYEAIRFGAPWKLVQKMVSRMTVDGAFSTIPIAGPIYDAMRLSHSQNARDLSTWLSGELVLAGERSHGTSAMNPVVATV